MEMEQGVIKNNPTKPAITNRRGDLKKAVEYIHDQQGSDPTPG
jgi:hypothetical protein